MLAELLLIAYALVGGVLGALLGGKLQRRLAYQRGYRHGLAVVPPANPTEFARGFLAGLRAGGPLSVLETRLAEIRASQS